MSKELLPLSEQTLEQWQTIQQYLPSDIIPLIKGIIRCAYSDGKEAGVILLNDEILRLSKELK